MPVPGEGWVEVVEKEAMSDFVGISGHGLMRWSAGLDEA